MQNTHSKAKDEGEACIINQASKKLTVSGYHVVSTTTIIFVVLLAVAKQYAICHCVGKSYKKSHSTLRAKRATFAF